VQFIILLYHSFIYCSVILIDSFLKEKEVETTNQNGKKRGNPTGISPRNRKACQSISAALLQSIAKIRAQGTMKSSRKF
jgi:hypothetical protein